jgi:glycosyltransferase involved in cell wall biosynthesis
VKKVVLMLKFSIIVPVYNTAAVYLRECLDSILSQTYRSIELLIINDGSTNPETLAVLSEYEQSQQTESKTLIVKHTVNKGQGAARNTGLSLATGHYILFLDNDDYYMSNTFFEELSVLLEESQADMCSFQYAEFFSDNKRPSVRVGDLPREKVFGKDPDTAVKTLLSSSRNVFSGATHTKVIKTSLIRDNGIIAPEGVKNEDISLTAQIIRYAKTYDRYNKVVHAYRRANVDSLSTKTDNSFKIAHDILFQFQTLLSDKGFSNNRNVLDFLASPYVYWIGKMVSALVYSDKDKKERELIGRDIEAGAKFTYLLKYSSRIYVRCFGVVVRLFGLRFAMFLLKVYLIFNRKHMLSIKRKIK